MNWNAHHDISSDLNRHVAKPITPIARSFFDFTFLLRELQRDKRLVPALRKRLNQTGFTGEV